MAENYPSPPETVADYEDIFHPLDAVARELDGSISPPRGGIRNIKKRRLEKSSEEYPDAADLALAVEEISLEDTLTIPEVLFSMQTYRYCGFTPAVADDLWHRIDAVPEPSAFEDQGRRTALQTMGFDSETQDVIMLEEFADLRLTESASFWGEDTVDSRLGALEEVKRASWERSQQAHSVNTSLYISSSIE